MFQACISWQEQHTPTTTGSGCATPTQHNNSNVWVCVVLGTLLSSHTTKKRYCQRFSRCPLIFYVGLRVEEWLFPTYRLAGLVVNSVLGAGCWCQCCCADVVLIYRVVCGVTSVVVRALFSHQQTAPFTSLPNIVHILSIRIRFLPFTAKETSWARPAHHI